MGGLLKTGISAGLSAINPFAGALANTALSSGPLSQRAQSLAGAGLDAGINKIFPQRAEPTPSGVTGAGNIHTLPGTFFTPEKQAQITPQASQPRQGFFSQSLPAAPQTTTAPAAGPRFTPRPRDPGTGGGFNFSSNNGGGFFSGGNNFGSGVSSRPIGGGFSISSAGPRTTNPFRFIR